MCFVKGWKDLPKQLISEIQSSQSLFLEDWSQKMFHELRTNNSCKKKNLTIKTDMNKAYDRVEWKFIDVMLIKNWVLCIDG